MICFRSLLRSRIYIPKLIDYWVGVLSEVHATARDRQLICQTWFTDSINVAFKRRCRTNTRVTYGKFLDLRLLYVKLPLWSLRRFSRASLFAAWFLLLFPLAIHSILHARCFVKAKKIRQRNKEVVFPTRWRVPLRTPRSRAVFHFEFSKHRSTSDRVYAEEWLAVK